MVLHIEILAQKWLTINPQKLFFGSSWIILLCVVWELAAGGSVVVAVGVSNMWQMTRDIWHITHDTWHLTPDTWHLSPDTWHVTCDTWHLKPDTWHLTPDTWHMTHDIWHVTTFFYFFFCIAADVERFNFFFFSGFLDVWTKLGAYLNTQNSSVCNAPLWI